MKKLDTFSQRVLAVGASLSLVLLSASLFFQTAPFAKADSFPASMSSDAVDGFHSEGISGMGAYQMEYQMIYDPSKNDYAHFVLVYNTETGNSKMYYREGKTYLPSSGQMPDNPL